MTTQELMDRLDSILPNCTFDTDNQGQLIIYTDLRDNGIDMELTPFEPDDEDEELDDYDAIMAHLRREPDTMVDILPKGSLE